MILKPIKNDIWKFYAICKPDHSCPLLTWFNNIPKDQSAHAKKLFAQIDKAANQKLGPTLLPVEISHIVNEKYQIYEFIAGKLRLLWFYSPFEKKVIICSLGFRKKDQKTPKKHIDSVIRDKKAYIEAIENGNIIILED